MVCRRRTTEAYEIAVCPEHREFLSGEGVVRLRLLDYQLGALRAQNLTKERHQPSALTRRQTAPVCYRAWVPRPMAG